MDSEYDRMRAQQERARAETSTDMAAARVHRQLAELFEERAGNHSPHSQRALAGSHQSG